MFDRLGLKGFDMSDEFVIRIEGLDLSEEQRDRISHLLQREFLRELGTIDLVQRREVGIRLLESPGGTRGFIVRGVDDE